MTVPSGNAAPTFNPKAAADKAQEFRVEHYAVICPGGQLLQRYRTLDLAKRYCKILNSELNGALAAEEKRANDSIEENVRLMNRLAAEQELLGQQIEATSAARLRATDCEKQLATEREKVTLATQMVQIESKRANEAERKVQTLVKEGK